MKTTTARTPCRVEVLTHAAAAGEDRPYVLTVPLRYAQIVAEELAKDTATTTVVLLVPQTIPTLPVGRLEYEHTASGLFHRHSRTAPLARYDDDEEWRPTHRHALDS